MYQSGSFSSLYFPDWEKVAGKDKYYLSVNDGLDPTGFGLLVKLADTSVVDKWEIWAITRQGSQFAGRVESLDLAKSMGELLFAIRYLS